MWRAFQLGMVSLEWESRWPTTCEQLTSSASAWSKTQAWFFTLCSNLNVACVSRFRAMLECYQLLEYHRVLPVIQKFLDIANACLCVFHYNRVSQPSATDISGWIFLFLEVFLFIIGSLAVPWPPPTRCQDHSSACDNQRCFQMLSNFPQKVGAGQ